MILKTLKSNRSINLILFPVIAVLLWIRGILNPVEYPFYNFENKNLLYLPLAKIPNEYLLIKVISALILVIFIAFLIQLINDRFAFIRTRTKLPASLFVIISSGFTLFHTLHPVYFAAIFFLLAIHSLFTIFNNPDSLSNIFNGAVFLGIGSLFYFNLIFLFPAYWIGIFILYRETSWRQLVIPLLGLAVPYIFAISYAFFTDFTLEFFHTLEQNIITPVNHFKENYPLYAILFLLIFLTVMGSFKMLQQYDSRKISTRKYFTVFLLFFVFSLIAFVLVPAVSIEMLIISMIPLTFLVSNLLVSIQSRFWGEFLFTLLLATVIAVQFSDLFL